MFYRSSINTSIFDFATLKKMSQWIKITTSNGIAKPNSLKLLITLIPIYKIISNNRNHYTNTNYHICQNFLLIIIIFT